MEDPFPPDPSPAELRLLRERLLGWFAEHGRDLPWRRDRDPYRVWISEAMLQQTRVATVIAYYERFLARWPTLGSLAAAPLDDVLALWSGLGYYRRARALHEGARAIVAEHGGRFPDEPAAALALPGIGPYTAGAVLSIAYGRREPLVDGNVARVLARLFGLAGDPAGQRLRAETWRRAGDLLPPEGEGDPGAWNQALMELGALVCTPRDPTCGACPLAEGCNALATDRVEMLPGRKRRRAPIEVELVVLAIADGDRVLLERRPVTGRMAELWQLPTIELPDRSGLSGADTRLHPASWPAAVARAAGAREALGVVRHTITNHRIRAEVFRGEIAVDPPLAPFAWVARGDLEERALTGIARKVLAAPFFPRCRRAVRAPRMKRDAASAILARADLRSDPIERPSERLTARGISFVVPAYNEEKGIEGVVERLSGLALGVPVELVVVDDGSEDGTAAVLARIAPRHPGLRVIRHPQNRGYGAALKTGFARATHAVVVITDADGTYPENRIAELLACIDDGAEMAVGARTGPEVAMPLLRRPAKAFLKMLASYLASTPIPDLNSGLRAIRRDLVMRYRPILPQGFSFTTTITLAALTNDHRVDYVSIDYAKRAGSSKIRPIRDTLGFTALIVRTVIYFNPLKVFYPVAALFGFLLAGSLWYDIVLQPQPNLSDKSVLMFVAFVQVLSVGLLADLIDKRSRL